MTDGVSTRELFEINRGTTLAYNDFIILPDYTDFGTFDIDLTTKLSKNISLKIPLISSPMDKVTEDEMAKWMALLGGIGIIHYNNTIEAQCEMVKRVKNFENGFISNPLTKGQNELIGTLKGCKYTNIPITENGKLIGLLTTYDFSFEKHSNLPIKERMKPLKQLTVATIDEISFNNKLNLSKANDILLENSCTSLPIIDENGVLKYLVTRKDIETNSDYPLATKDSHKKLMVGAAVGTQEEDKKRVDALAKVGVNAIKIDSAHGHTSYQIEMIKYIKKKYPEIDILSGNVVTSVAVKNLAEAGVDAICCGMGIGSICITQEVTATGRAQASAIYATAEEAKKYNIPVIADGGIAQSGQILKAWILGADTCMLGNMLAGTDESPGEWIITANGEKFKEYRGMGSYEAMKEGSAKRYSVNMAKEKAAEGVVAQVQTKGHIYDFIQTITAGIKQGLIKIGCKNLEEIKEKNRKEKIRVELRTASAQSEGNVHDLIMIK